MLGCKESGGENVSGVYNPSLLAACTDAYFIRGPLSI